MFIIRNTFQGQGGSGMRPNDKYLQIPTNRTTSYKVLTNHLGGMFVDGFAGNVKTRIVAITNAFNWIDHWQYRFIFT